MNVHYRKSVRELLSSMMKNSNVRKYFSKTYLLPVISIALQSFALPFYNFVGLFNLKHVNGKFEVSNFTSVVNVVKALSCMTVIVFVNMRHQEDDGIFRHDLVYIPQFSYFSKVSLALATILIQSTSWLLFAIQLFRRYSVKLLVNHFSRIKLSEIYHEKCKKLCIVHTAYLTSAYISYAFVKYTAMMQPSFLNAIMFSIFIYPGLLVVGFVSLLKFCENFIITSLKQFKFELKETLNNLNPNESFNAESFQKFSQKYQEIFNFAQNFNRTLDVQLTVVTCFITASIIFTVNLFEFYEIYI